MKKYISLTLALLLLLSLLAGCGASNGASRDYAVEEMAPAETMAASNALTAETGSGSEILPENRKWIITVDMSAETEDLDALLAALDAKITQLEGYVEDQNIYNGSSYASRRYRYANLTVRIPAGDVDLFTEEVSGISNVVRTNKNLEDVTLSYTATESRVKALETEEARLLELMEQAETMADLLEIEARLTEVRYELERYASQLRLYDNQIDYATIYLNIEEVQEYTPVAEQTRWEKITTGFAGSLKGLWNGVLDALVWVIVNLPYIVVLGGAAAAVLLGIRKRARAKHAKLSEEKKEE